jgi:hypothetical protein
VAVVHIARPDTGKWRAKAQEQLFDVAKHIRFGLLLASWLIEYVVRYWIGGSVASIKRREDRYIFWEPSFFHRVDRWLGKPRLKGSFDEGDRD